MRTRLEGSSLGWNPKEKRQETFNKDARFLVYYSQGTDSPSRPSDEIAGFGMFRFEGDDQGPEGLLESVVYCWEVQVKPKFRQQGIAGKFVEAMKLIGAKCEMKKVMLTVLKDNENAIRLYRKHGFVVDPSSPEPDEGADYEIMSCDIEI